MEVVESLKFIHLKDPPTPNLESLIEFIPFTSFNRDSGMIFFKVTQPVSENMRQFGLKKELKNQLSEFKS